MADHPHPEVAAASEDHQHHRALEEAQESHHRRLEVGVLEEALHHLEVGVPAVWQLLLGAEVQRVRHWRQLGQEQGGLLAEAVLVMLVLQSLLPN